MFIEFKEVYNPETRRRSKKAVCECDFCKLIFETSPSQIKNSFKTTNLTFCKLDCAQNSKKKGGALSIKTSETLKEKYGEDHNFKRKEVREKVVSEETNKRRAQTNIEKHGSENPFGSKQIQKKIKETNLKNLGFEHPAQNPEILKKMEETNLERFGVKNAMQCEEIKEKAEETCLAKYGTTHPMKNEIIKNKAKENFKTKYGTHHPFLVPEIKEKINFKKACEKQHQSKKLNGSYGKSKAEDSFYETFLLIFFLLDDIERQKIIGEMKWAIDFYIKSLNLYIQFDGRYYHGLDRPVELIKECRTKVDVSICQTILRDQSQNLYFANNSLKLLRISDKKFSEMQSLNQEQNLFSQIQEFAASEQNLLILH